MTRWNARKENKRPSYVVPVGGFEHWEQATENFAVGVHLKLTERQFRDPLDYLEWNVWFHERLLDVAKAQRDEMIQLGIRTSK